MARDKLNIRILQEKEGVYENVDIDLFDFLENSSDSEPILVVSDIHLPKGKKRPLPNFSKVYSDAKIFNSGDWRITPDSVLPNGISELICLYSISSIGDLIGVLPHSTEIVRVRNNIFNNIAKKEDVSIAKSFIELYPDVVVYDERGNTLAQITSEKLDLKNEKTSVAPKQDTAEIIRLPKKTPDWICADDFVKYVKENNILTQLSKEELKRYFQQARSPKAGLNLESCQMWLPDDKQVSCVKAKYIDKIVKYIQQQEAAKAAPKKTEEKTPVKKTAKTTVNTETSTQEIPRTCCLKEKTVEKTEIKKYMKKSVKKAVEKKCGNNKVFQDFLQTINNVNLMPRETDTNILNINDQGVISPISSLDFKCGTCISQPLPNSNAARVIWVIKGNDLIAIKYFPSHDGKNQLEYKNYFRNIPDEDIPEIEDCIDIQTLIHDSGNTPPPGGGNGDDDNDNKTKKKPQIESHEENSAETPTDIIKSFEVETATEPDAAPSEPNDVANQETESKKWVDITSVAYEFNQEYNLTQRKADRLVRGISEEKDISKKIKYANVLVELLKAQKQLEEKIKKLEEINRAIKELNTKSK